MARRADGAPSRLVDRLADGADAGCSPFVWPGGRTPGQKGAPKPGCAAKKSMEVLTPGGVLYRYAWGNNPRRAELKGRLCRIVRRGSRGTVLVRFEDNGDFVTTSGRALRRVR